MTRVGEQCSSLAPVPSFPRPPSAAIGGPDRQQAGDGRTSGPYGCFFSAWRCRRAAFRVVRMTLALPKVEVLLLVSTSQWWLEVVRTALSRRSHEGRTKHES